MRQVFISQCQAHTTLRWDSFSINTCSPVDSLDILDVWNCVNHCEVLDL